MSSANAPSRILLEAPILNWGFVSTALHPQQMATVGTEGQEGKTYSRIVRTSYQTRAPGPMLRRKTLEGAQGLVKASPERDPFV